jgi:hypothetical protein
VTASGNGVPPNLRVAIHLLAFAPARLGNPAVVAIDRRIDLSAPIGTNPSGSVQFQNNGSGDAVGLASSDVPWIIPQSGTITIPPGGTVTVNFTIDRSQRADASAPNGSATGSFLFIYPPGSTARYAPNDAAPPSLSAGVPISDTVKGPSTQATLPPLSAGEVAIVLPGVGHVTGSGGREYVSDVSIVNSVSGSLSDVQLYFVTASVSLAAPQALPASQSVMLADAVTSYFGTAGEVGTLHIRSHSADKLSVAANIFNRSNARGTFGTAIPAFRTTRAIGANETLAISGLRKDATSHTNVFVQEVSGTPATADVSFFDTNGGAPLTTIPSVSIAAFGLTQLILAAPDGTVFATIANHGPGRIVAYATPLDEASGDTWALADWSRQYAIGPADPQIVAVAGAAPGANNTYFRTDLSLTNAGKETATGVLRYFPSNIARPLSLAPGETRVIKDVVTQLFNVPAPSVGYLLFTPDQPARIALSSRTYTTVQNDIATFGTGVPTLPMSAALRKGESRVFGGLDDSTHATVVAARPATFRTNFGMIETSGQGATVRISVFFSDGRQLAAGGPVASKSYVLVPNDFQQYSGLVESIVGSSRETTYGDLHNVQVRFEVTGGSGSVVPFVTSADNGTGDTVLRTE